MAGQYAKEITRFPLYFIVRTEGVAYCIIVPIIIVYGFIMLGYSPEQLVYMAVFGSGAFILSAAITMMNDLLVIRPVSIYFHTLTAGEVARADETARARKRFFRLPHIHAIGAGFRWLFGMSLFMIPFMHFAGLNEIQRKTLWLVVVGGMPLIMIGFFLLTERMIYAMNNNGLFPPVETGERVPRLSIYLQMTFTILTVMLLPFIFLLSCFFIHLHSCTAATETIYIQMAVSGLIGIAGALFFTRLLSSSIIGKISNIKGFLGDIEQGNLVSKIDSITANDELGDIYTSVSSMKESLRGIIKTVSDGSRNLDHTSGVLDDASSGLFSHADALALIIDESIAMFGSMLASFEDITVKAMGQSEKSLAIRERIRSIDSHTRQMRLRVEALQESMKATIHQVDDGAAIMTDALSAIGGTAEYLRSIEEVMEQINEIADQINMLAMNATIEAARAGEAGRGFTVVADQINRLAERANRLSEGIRSTITGQTASMSRELSHISGTTELLNRIQSSLGETAVVIEGTRDFTRTLESMNEEIAREADMLAVGSGDIYQSSDDRKAEIKDLAVRIHSIDDISRLISDTAEQVRHLSQTLSVTLDINIRQVRRFKVQ